MDQKKIGQFLKQLRNEKSMTQEQLAKQFNVSSRTVSRWETGSNLPDISLLVEIADFYDVDVREIIEGERKSEMMDEELREVADKMADYAGNEKLRLLRKVQVTGIISVILALLSLVLQVISYEPDLRRSLAILFSFAVFVMLGIITLYVTGVLEKLVKKRKLMLTVKIVTIVLLSIGAYFVTVSILVVGLASLSISTAKIKTCDDVSMYSQLIRNDNHGNADKYGICSKDNFYIFPEKITRDMKVDEFEFMYYNPWDPQHIIYMTVEYDDDAYDTEMKRLEKAGVEEYEGIYLVTGEPEGYDIVAMNSDDYHGFVYAMIPEDGNANKITYVGIWFCNYFLDADVHDYMPDRYLLPGFDATGDNAYREKKLSENK